MTVRDMLILWFLRRWVMWRKTGDERFRGFTGMDLERIDRRHPLSGLRIARMIRLDGLVQFECASRNGSVYTLGNVDVRRVAEDLRKRRSKWSGEELTRIREVVLDATVESARAEVA